MRIAVIPARGGSKRIPRKNIRPFNGRPMIANAIRTALESDQFEHVIVSTDDDEIADIAATYGASLPFRRPAELADDHTPTVPVIQHAARSCIDLGWPVRHLCCIYPCVPFLMPQDLAEAFKLLGSTKDIYAFAVAAFPSPIQRALRRSADATVAPFDPHHVGTRSQDLENAYFDAGQFYWGSAAAWLSGRPIHANAKTIVIPEWRVVDIDTPDDWERAERLSRVLSG